MSLKFMEQMPLKPELMTCPECGEEKRIGIHSHQERRYICPACKATFAETKGTLLYGLPYPIWVVVLVLTLLAHGCSVQAIVVAFCLDERTVAAWQSKAGQPGERIPAAIVCNGRVELGQVQADEICVTTQHGQVWMATAMTVFSRLFVWGEVGAPRPTGLIERVMAHVRTAAQGVQAVLFAIDGLAAYPKAVLKHFYTAVRTGQPGRPAHQVWPDLHIVQVVKQHTGKRLTGIQRRVAHGCLDRIHDLRVMSQCGLGLINTAYIERLNATFRARLPALTRRTRSLAQTADRLRAEMFWSGVIYNFCTVHTSLSASPAMAADLTDHVWSVEELVRFRVPST